MNEYEDHLVEECYHDSHLTIKECMEHVNEGVPGWIDRVTLARMFVGFNIKSCGTRRTGQSGKPSNLYNVKSVDELVNLIRMYRGKL